MKNPKIEKVDKMLNVSIHAQSQEDALEKIQKNIHNKYSYMQIVSLNPENLVLAFYHEKFRQVLSESAIQLIDGVGIKIGGFVTGIKLPERVTGSDFMLQLIESLKNKEPSVLLIGGKGNIAERLAKCYAKKYPNLKFFGLSGFENILKPKNSEIQNFLSIVASLKPNLILAAFGSPAQELFFDKYKNSLNGVICMGVGGGFDFASGKVRRAPKFIRKIGMEWFFRLLIEPWRIRRQFKLAKFIYLILLQKLNSFFSTNGK